MTLPVVALHGFTGTGQSFIELGLENAVYPLLTGHGPDPDLSSKSFDQELARLGKVLAASGPQVHLLGYSMGARVALGLALAHPGQVGRLTLIGANPGLESDDEREDRLAWESRWIDVLDVDGIAVFEHQWRALPIFDSQSSLPPAALEQQLNQRLSHTAEGLSHSLQTLGLGVMPNYWPRLSELPAATEVIVGAKDSKFQQIAKRMKMLAPQLKVESIANSGHNPLLEAPARLKSIINQTQHAL